MLSHFCRRFFRQRVHIAEHRVPEMFYLKIEKEFRNKTQWYFLDYFPKLTKKFTFGNYCPCNDFFFFLQASF